MEVLGLKRGGSCIDKEGIVYPAYRYYHDHKDGKIVHADFDKHLGCHLEDISDEWLEYLSIKDTRL